MSLLVGIRPVFLAEIVEQGAEFDAIHRFRVPNFGASTWKSAYTRLQSLLYGHLPDGSDIRCPCCGRPFRLMPNAKILSLRRAR